MLCNNKGNTTKFHTKIALLKQLIKQGQISLKRVFLLCTAPLGLATFVLIFLYSTCL